MSAPATTDHETTLTDREYRYSLPRRGSRHGVQFYWLYFFPFYLFLGWVDTGAHPAWYPDLMAATFAFFFLFSVFSHLKFRSTRREFANTYLRLGATELSYVDREQALRIPYDDISEVKCSPVKSRVRLAVWQKGKEWLEISTRDATLRIDCEPMVLGSLSDLVSRLKQAIDLSGREQVYDGEALHAFLKWAVLHERDDETWRVSALRDCRLFAASLILGCASLLFWAPLNALFWVLVLAVLVSTVAHIPDGYATWRLKRDLSKAPSLIPLPEKTSLVRARRWAVGVAALTATGGAVVVSMLGITTPLVALHQLALESEADDTVASLIAQRNEYRRIAYRRPSLRPPSISGNGFPPLIEAVTTLTEMDPEIATEFLEQCSEQPSSSAAEWLEEQAPLLATLRHTTHYESMQDLHSSWLFREREREIALCALLAHARTQAPQQCLEIITDSIRLAQDLSTGLPSPAVRKLGAMPVWVRGTLLHCAYAADADTLGRLVQELRQLNQTTVRIGPALSIQYLTEAYLHGRDHLRDATSDPPLTGAQAVDVWARRFVSAGRMQAAQLLDITVHSGNINLDSPRNENADWTAAVQQELQVHRNEYRDGVLGLRLLLAAAVTLKVRRESGGWPARLHDHIELVDPFSNQALMWIPAQAGGGVLRASDAAEAAQSALTREPQRIQLREADLSIED